MALNKVLHSTRFLGYSSLSEANERQKLSQKILVDLARGSTVIPRNGSSFKCSLNHHRPDEGSGKARVVAVNKSLFHGEDLGLKLVHGNGSCKDGRPLEFPNQSMPDKMVVAVDVDEVLGSFISALNKFIADRYSLNHTVSEYFVYEFFRIWNCSRAEADFRVHEFFKTPYFASGIQPIPGARSRQNVIKEHTLDWIEKHYPGLFQEIYFGNHFSLDGQSKPKSEICRSLGAQVLIDDNPRYALECAEVGIRVLLFDYDDSYPWSKSDKVSSHPLVTKVNNWEQVEQHIISWAVLI